MSFFEWLGRLIMLVLAGMITLSIISALAAISSQSTLPRQIGIERAPVPVPPQQPQPQPQAQQQVEPEPPQPPGEQQPAAQKQAQMGEAVMTDQPDPAADGVERWLEAISYALLAIAGLGVLGCALIWRAAREQRRIADALEAISAAPRPSSSPPI